MFVGLALVATFCLRLACIVSLRPPDPATLFDKAEAATLPAGRIVRKSRVARARTGSGVG